jgi:hypothetical protein
LTFIFPSGFILYLLVAVKLYTNWLSFSFNVLFATLSGIFYLCTFGSQIKRPLHFFFPSSW